MDDWLVFSELGSDPGASDIVATSNRSARTGPPVPLGEETTEVPCPAPASRTIAVVPCLAPAFDDETALMPCPAPATGPWDHSDGLFDLD